MKKRKKLKYRASLKQPGIGLRNVYLEWGNTTRDRNVEEESASATKEKLEGWTKDHINLYTPVGGGMEIS